MSVEIAVFVRWVSVEEVLDDLVNEAKGRTWDGWAEHSLVQVEGERLALIGGVWDGISFRVKGDGPGRTLHMDIEGQEVQVIRILWHTHPLVTGPSDGDLDALVILGQEDSVIYEIGVQKDGTRIRPKSGTTPD